MQNYFRRRNMIQYSFCFAIEILYTELFIYLRKTLELPFLYFRFAILGKPPLISNIQWSIECGYLNQDGGKFGRRKYK